MLDENKENGIAANPNTLFHNANIPSTASGCVCNNQNLMCKLTEGGKSRDIHIISQNDTRTGKLLPTQCTESGVTASFQFRKTHIYQKTIKSIDDIPSTYNLNNVSNYQILIDGQSYFAIKEAFASDPSRLQIIIGQMDKYAQDQQQRWDTFLHSREQLNTGNEDEDFPAPNPNSCCYL